MSVNDGDNPIKVVDVEEDDAVDPLVLKHIWDNDKIIKILLAKTVN